jgi:hypothetical protein
MSFQCEYCKNSFKTKSNYNKHQQSANYCLLKRRIEVEKNFECEICDKSFSLKDTYQKHYTSCINHPGVIKLRKQIDVLSEENTQLKTINKQVEIYKKQIQDLQDKLENIAVKAVNRPITSNTTNTTNTNNIMNLAPLDMNIFSEKLKTFINENMTEQHLLDGQEGIARLIAPCFTQEDGRKLITCTDTSRNIWKSKDTNGNILKDVKANNIAKTVQPLAVSKADILIDLDGKKRTKIYELRDIEKRKKERIELDEKDEATMRGMKVGSGHYRMYEERIRKRNEEREKDEELEQQLLEEFREADELYLINLDDDEKPFKLYAGKEEIKNLKEDSGKFSTSLITLV